MKRATEKVVYLLGAGFSAPLGLPVMANFLDVSRDIYHADPGNKDYESWKKIFETIAGMHVAKSYYKTDLRNIEEVLSILAMEDAVAGGDRNADFAEYIKGVIRACEPDWPPPAFATNGDRRLLDKDMHQELMGVDEPHRSYRTFVACLLNTKLLGFLSGALCRTNLEEPEAEYSVVTLNYDRVLEACQDHIQAGCSALGPGWPTPNTLRIAKLHGSVDREVIPPTWRKGETRHEPDIWTR